MSSDLYGLYDDADYRKVTYFTTLKDSVGLDYKYDTGENPSYLGDVFMLRTARLT